MTKTQSSEPEARRPRRVRRRAEGIVAQYIHELSERHREALRGIGPALTAAGVPAPPAHRRSGALTDALGLSLLARGRVGRSPPPLPPAATQRIVRDVADDHERGHRERQLHIPMAEMRAVEHHGAVELLRSGAELFGSEV